MTTRPRPARIPALLATTLGFALASLAQEAPQFTRFQPLTNQELALTVRATTGQVFRLDTTVELPRWTPLLSYSGLSLQHTDTAAPFLPLRFYRAWRLPETNLLTGDYLGSGGDEWILHPVNHASFLLSWNGKVIYGDPVGGASRFTGLPRADLILLTHGHSDHYDATTLSAVKGANAVILAPVAVYQSMPTTLKALTTTLTNGASVMWQDVGVEAVPAYNLTASNHPRGQGNGYLLTVGGRRLYVSGDTDDIPELRSLTNIDVALVCMNPPYTMSVDKAASAVRDFRPAVVYPYHYSGNDLERFKRLVGRDVRVEVRFRKWY